MTSIEAIIVTLMPTLNISLSVAIALKAAIQNNFSKSWRFSRGKSVVEFSYSKTFVFGIHNNFTNDSETYDTVKLYLSCDSSFFSLQIMHYSN